MENGEQSAFPCKIEDGFSQDGSGQITGLKTSTSNGLSKREYFAGLAMQGLLNRPDTNTAWLVRESIQIADELLTQLSHGR